MRRLVTLLHRMFDRDYPDPGLAAPVPPAPEGFPRRRRDSFAEGFACRMTERPWEERNPGAEREPALCGRPKSPAEPTCRREECIAAYRGDLDAALASENRRAARRRAAEARRGRAKVLPIGGRNVG